MTRTGRPPKHEKEVRTCNVCAKTWLSYPYVKSNKKYCSRECMVIGRTGVPRGPYVEREARNCEHCGGSFLVGGCDRKKDTRFCSVPCSTRGRWDGVPGHETPIAMDREDAAWFAGLFDGEGCVAWPKRHRFNECRISIANTSLPLLERAKEVTGTGKIREVTKYRKNPKHNRAWVWNCYAANAREVLSQILPWLIVKKEAAEIVLGIRRVKELPWTQPTIATRNEAAL